MSSLDNLPDYPTKNWYLGIKNHALNFLSYLTKEKKSKNIKLDEGRFKNIFRYFYVTMTDMKQRIYKSNDPKNNFDKHKILAIYIKSILVNRPFQIDSKIRYDYSPAERIANEIFCISLIELVLIAYEPSEPHKRLVIPRHEKNWFVRLLNYHSIFPDTLDILSMSQIIYYLEKEFFKLSP